MFEQLDGHAKRVPIDQMPRCADKTPKDARVVLQVFPEKILEFIRYDQVTNSTGRVWRSGKAGGSPVGFELIHDPSNVREVLDAQQHQAIYLI